MARRKEKKEGYQKKNDWIDDENRRNLQLGISPSIYAFQEDYRTTRIASTIATVKPNPWSRTAASLATKTYSLGRKREGMRQQGAGHEKESSATVGMDVVMLRDWVPENRRQVRFVGYEKSSWIGSVASTFAMNDGPVPDQQPLDRVSVNGSFVGLGSGQLGPAKEPLKQKHETGVSRHSTHCLP